MRLLYVANDGFAFFDGKKCLEHEEHIKALRQKETERELETLKRYCTALMDKMTEGIEEFLDSHPEMNMDDVLDKLSLKLEVPNRGTADETTETENP